MLEGQQVYCNQCDRYHKGCSGNKYSLHFCKGQSFGVTTSAYGEFYNKLAANQIDLDPEIAQWVEEHFWKLF